MAAVFQVVLLIVLANFLPPLARMVLGDRFGQPLDFGWQWFDGRPLFGSHKTWRGFLASVAGTALAGEAIGVGWRIGAVTALLALLGDLVTSFAKRRAGYSSGRNVLILDHLLEGLLPTIFLFQAMSLGLGQAFLAAAVFLPVTSFGSWLWNYLVWRIPESGYPRIVRSTTRLREWRSCHLPLARWQVLLNFENFFYYRVLIRWFFKFSGLYRQGEKNALVVIQERETMFFDSLPEAFDGFTIMLLTDLHLDGMPELVGVLRDQLAEIEVDLCLIGGDIRMEMYGPIAPSVRLLKKVLPSIRSRFPVIGVLGNHDCIEMLPDLEEAGVTMLVNDAWPIEKNGARLWVVGVDDPHYYKCHDLPTAFGQVKKPGFTIFLAHSPELYRDAEVFAPALYLCGHTHGGQFRLPGQGPLFTHCAAPRFTAAGRWRYRDMQGYTSRGVGASGVPLRFNCPGEITILTLRRSGQAD